MSFGAMAGWQAWLLLAAAVGGAVWLFRLKVRPPRISVPSLVLWRRVLDQKRELSWWERVRRAVSLVVTALIALALAVALTRPGPAASGNARGRVLIVLDSSWSMLAARANGQTRWAQAQAEARALAASASGDAVTLATTAEGIVEGPTNDTALIESAIDRLRPIGGETADWPRVPGEVTTHFITDGVIARAVDAAVVVHSVYEPADNVAITAFNVRPGTGREAAGAAYLEMANYAAVKQSVRLRISRGANALFDQPVEMAAGEVVRQVVPVAPTGDPRLTARLTADRNAMTVDDEALVWIDGADGVSVTLVSDQPAPIAAVLAAMPAVRVTTTTLAAYRPAREDVVIFDRVVPAEAPRAPALLIAPTAQAWLGTTGSDVRTPRWTKASVHPVLAGVDPLTVEIRRALPLSAPTLTTIAATDAGEALVSVADAADRRLIVVSFTLADSNLAKAQAFPILMGNAIEWLARPAEGSVHRPGLVRLPASTTRLATMDGSRVIPVQRTGQVSLATIDAPGTYVAEAAGSRRVLSVNVGDPLVSNVNKTTISATTQGLASVAGARPWWLYALAMAFVLLVAEWWTWQQRVTV